MAEHPILGEGVPTSRKYSWISAVKLRRARQSTRSMPSSHPRLMDQVCRSREPCGDLTGFSDEAFAFFIYISRPCILQQWPWSCGIPCDDSLSLCVCLKHAA